MKTKNIFKIGVFSIIILSLLINPIFVSNAPEAKAETPMDSEVIKTNTTESSPEELCKGTGKDGWLYALSQEWWEHVNCVVQKSAIAALGKIFNRGVTVLIKWILWAINPATYGGFSTNKAVENIWGNIRNIVNLFLILGLVFIAIATILGIKKYSWQQTLWKLIIVALLVNFSLVMAGMILDISHFFTYSFLNLTKGESTLIAKALIESFQVEKMPEKTLYMIANDNTITPESTQGWGLNMGNGLIVIILLVIIEVFTFMSLLSVFAAMIIRSFIITALLCLSPIAFASWIFPDTEKLWKPWWQLFIKWCTSPVLFALMLWMGVTVITSVNAGSSAELQIMSSLIRIFLFSMFLVGGLIFSVQGGGAAAQFVMKQSGKVGSAIKSVIGGAVVGGIQRSETYRKVGKSLTQTIFNPIGYKMLDQSNSARFTKLKEYEKKMEEEDKDYVKFIANGIKPNKMQRDQYARYTAAVKVAIRKGWLENGDAAISFISDNLNDPDFNSKEILAALPQYFQRNIIGKLEAITSSADIYMDELVTTLANMSTTDLAKDQNREKIFDEANNRSVDQKKLIQQITKRLTSSQQVALYGSFGNKYWNAKGMGGVGGVIDNAVQADPITAEIQQNQINSSPALEQVLNKPKEIRPPTPHASAKWNSIYKVWAVPSATGVLLPSPTKAPPVGKWYWDCGSNSYKAMP
ncbi:MAG: hypothetical protein WC306_02890 [Candidatus Paceibacterota bacterium]|jgi:hypothetical protein